MQFSTAEPFIELPMKREIYNIIRKLKNNKSPILCQIFKKGDTLDPINYRRISLLDTCYKILSTFLLKRITPYLEAIMGRYQCGFVKWKSTIDHVFTLFTLKQTMEKYYDKDLHMIFVDYKQIYVSVNRKEL